MEEEECRIKSGSRAGEEEEEVQRKCRRSAEGEVNSKKKEEHITRMCRIENG